MLDRETAARRTYARDATAWRAYLPHLPAGLVPPLDSLARESSWAWDGLDVHLDRFPRPDAPVTVVVLHGGGGYGRLLAPFARLVAALGADVVAPDLPGYGLTACPSAGMRYARWVRCAAALAEAERARTGRPVVLLGASMGGMLALHAAMAAAPGTAAGVAATTLLDPREPAVRRGVGLVPMPRAALRAPVLDRVRVPVGLVAPVRRMSSIRAVNRLVARDPQGGGNRVPLGFWRSWLTDVPPMEPRTFDRCPVLLAHPLADRWTPVAWSRAVLDTIPAPTRFVGLERAEHLPLEEPGVTQLRDALAAWLPEVVAAAGRVAPSLP